MKNYLKAIFKKVQQCTFGVINCNGHLLDICLTPTAAGWLSWSDEGWFISVVIGILSDRSNRIRNK